MTSHPSSIQMWQTYKTCQHFSTTPNIKYIELNEIFIVSVKLNSKNKREVVLTLPML